MEVAWFECAVMFTYVSKSTFLLDCMIPNKDVVRGHIFHSKLNSEGVASSSGSWEVLLINPSLWQEILPVLVGSRKLFSLLLKTVLPVDGSASS